MAYSNVKVDHGKMVLPGKPGPERKHHCPEHGGAMTPVKVFGTKTMRFSCKDGCRLPREQTVLK